MQKLSWNLINQFVVHLNHSRIDNGLNGGHYGNKGWISINFFVVYGHHLQNYDELNGGRDEGECWTERNNYSSKETRSQSRPREHYE
mgnify:CR=1 FL=1